jgi:hypothetical protein
MESNKTDTNKSLKKPLENSDAQNLSWAATNSNYLEDKSEAKYTDKNIEETNSQIGIEEVFRRASRVTHIGNYEPVLMILASN